MKKPFEPDMSLPKHCVDATEDVIIRVGVASVKLAARWDPRLCALAIAASNDHRLLVRGVVWVQVYKSRAYVLYRDSELPVRYQLNHATQTLLMNFDAGGGFPLGDYVFMAIPPSETAEAKRDRRPKYNNTDRKHKWRRQPKFTHQRITARAFAGSMRQLREKFAKEFPNEAKDI